jgi:hypothetical protein
MSYIPFLLMSSDIQVYELVVLKHELFCGPLHHSFVIININIHTDTSLITQDIQSSHSNSININQVET